MKFIPLPENAAAIERLADLLRRLPIGSVIHYADLNVAAGEGRDVSRGARHLLAAARKTVEREDGSRLEAVSGVGVKKLTAGEIVPLGLAHVRRTRRAALRGIDRLSGVSANLTEEQRATITAQRTVLGVAASVATINAVKAAAADVKNVNRDPASINVAGIVKSAMAQR